MPRKTLSPEQKRKTIAFTVAGIELNKLDRYISRESEKLPHAVISRQTILESLLREFIHNKESRS